MKPCITSLVASAMLTLAGLLLSTVMVSAKPSSAVWFAALNSSNSNACQSSTTPCASISGIATAEAFVANGSAATYPVTATVSGVTASTHFRLSNILWYVAPTGSDNNDCVHSTATCATIDGALGKSGFLPGDTVLVAMGTYTSPAAMGIWLRKDVILSGGWDTSFTAQSGQSTIDGQGVRRGFSVDSGVKVLLDRFNIQHGRDDNGAGIWNSGDLTVTHSTISNNAAGHVGWSGYGGGGGIENNNGRLVLINSAVTSNTLVGGFSGSGVFNGGTMMIDNTTISGNSGPEGIYNNPNNSLTLNSTTVYGNSNYGIRVAGLVYLRNTIIAANGIDCLMDQLNGGALASLGYNLVQNNLDCNLSNTDRTGIDPRLSSLQGSPAYHPLQLGSTAINGGNPAGCIGSTGLLVTDQRGLPRVGRCDIGAVEYQGIVSQWFLAFITRNYVAPCPPLYADNFSNPNSGWPTGDTNYVLREYLNGEYHVRLKDTNMWAGSTSGASFSDFIVSVDITNANITEGSFGVIFGLSPSDWNQFYTYEIETVPSGRYGIYKYNRGAWTKLAEGLSSSIGTREARNHIAVERNGSLIKAYANGDLLTSVSEKSYVGTRRVGLIVTAFNTSPVDVRFDNFSVFAPGCTANTAARDMTGSVINTSDELLGDAIEGPGRRSR